MFKKHLTYDREWLANAENRLTKAKAVKVGERFACPGCSCGRVKVAEKHYFCSKRCCDLVHRVKRLYKDLRNGDPEYPVINTPPEIVTHR